MIRIMTAALALAAAACTVEDPEPEEAEMTVAAREPDADKGRKVFVNKGCVICHSVNGVGGKAAPPLDAAVGESVIDPLDFAARIWRGAPAMIELQSVELGYTVDLTGADLAHLAAFAADREAQKKLALEDVPELMRGSFLDERFWEVEDWSEFLQNGQEGYGEPAPPPEESEPQ